MTQTTRTTIADGALTGHRTAVVLPALSLRPIENFDPFQATVVLLPKQIPTPASTGTATRNPFTWNPFVRQTAGPVNPFVKLQITGPSSQSSSSKFNNFHSTMILSLHPMLPCLAHWQHTSKTRGHQLHASKNKLPLSIP
ncbi:hypothetical protein DFH08DRAFT_970361 [Mycena albidolilacea]|uniref:Uncharacterized protein n=1 Tax=Mycena albidolilacea TaxID=1033008 RepID=A0AAD6ZGV4_9AGAR|nr:hypothetical protein DFH08DRAFT_970361 [Mycena albidolilacea]